MLAVTPAWSQDQIQNTQQSQTKDVSDKELHNFADAFTEIQSQNQKMQQEAVKTIQDKGMEVQRFNEIAKGKIIQMYRQMQVRKKSSKWRKLN